MRSQSGLWERVVKTLRMVEERNLRNGQEIGINHCEGLTRRIPLYVTIRKVLEIGHLNLAFYLKLEIKILKLILFHILFIIHCHSIF